MGCPQRRALRGGAAEDRDATKHHDGAEESARAKVTCAQRLRRAERRAAPSFDGAADGGCADPEGTLKGVALRTHPPADERTECVRSSHLGGQRPKYAKRWAPCVTRCSPSSWPSSRPAVARRTTAPCRRRRPPPPRPPPRPHPVRRASRTSPRSRSAAPSTATAPCTTPRCASSRPTTSGRR